MLSLKLFDKYVDSTLLWIYSLFRCIIKQPLVLLLTPNDDMTCQQGADQDHKQAKQIKIVASSDI